MVPEQVVFTKSRNYAFSTIDWLFERRDELANALVLVPTSQSSRRLRQGLAEKGAILAPKVMTPGTLLRLPQAAPDAVEVLAWTDALEAVSDWERYEAIFPESPASDGPGWSMGLARAFLNLRKSLQENGQTVASAARLIPALESERWTQLAELERDAEKRLQSWGYQSKSSLLAKNELALPVDLEQVIVAGVCDLPPVISRFFEVSDLPVTVLVPDEDVDPWGRPGLEWQDREIPWPQRGSVTLTGDPSQQAQLAVERLAEAGTPSSNAGLGTGDEEVAAELVRAFGRADWVVHDPGASLPSPVAGWLGAWRRYLLTPGVKEVIDLLAFDQGKFLVEGIRSMQVAALSSLRDSHLVRDLSDVTRARAMLAEALEKFSEGSKRNRLEYQLKSAEIAEAVMVAFEKLRRRFQKLGFHQGMRSLLYQIDRDGEAGLEEWLEATSDAAKAVDRSAAFWIDLLLHDLNPVSEDAPDNRVLDVQGWLELLHDPADHLVICGMNEGRVPGRASTDPWLPESAREVLGLPHEGSRAARDAYLLHALLKMREASGRVDLIVGKFSADGDVLTPSRLLLTAKGQTLAQHVSELFAEVEPADSGVAWDLEPHWKWTPKQVAAKDKISVTAFSKYLACPFRYYLQRVLGLNEPEPERVEWNNRDFGNVMHAVLENWGRDEKARDSADAKEIESWLLTELKALCAQQFGEVLPLAISLQIQSMRLRLGWFANRQAEIRAEGWRIIEVEHDIKLTLADTLVTGQIDRIERHDDGRVRVLDYKTSKEAKDVVKEHLHKYRGDPPAHLQHDEVIAPDGSTWKDLQLPLYAEAWGKVDEIGYFALGEQEQEVLIKPWTDFGPSQQASARTCAEWVIQRVRAGVFWPPAEKVTYEDFDDLIYGRQLAAAFNWEGSVA